jgi:hypothetical protein
VEHSYLAQDIDIVSWNISTAAMSTIIASTSPGGSPSWACKE